MNGAAGAFDGSGVDGLIVFLRTRGFPVGPSEALDVARLLRHLVSAAAAAEAPPDLFGLIPKLRPVLCKRAEDQARFEAVFHEWATLHQPHRPSGEAVAAPQAAGARPSRRPGRWLLGGLLLLIVLVIGWQSSQRAPVTGEGTAPVKQAPRTSAPAQAPVAPVAVVASPQFTGYYPAVRYNPELRPWAAGVLLGLGLLSLIGFSLPLVNPWLGHARRSGRQVPLDLSSLREEAQRIVPPLSADIQARLERHVPGPASARGRLQRRPPLHIGRTIEATLHRCGLLSLRYRDARLRPSYLLIVEVDARTGEGPQSWIGDPRGRMFYHWAERLRRRGIDVDIRLARYDDAAQTAVVCRPSGSGWRLDGEDGAPLDRLPMPPTGQRLVLVSDGHLLVDEANQWREWALRARFHRWPQRAMFTPVEPRLWGAREDAIERRERPTDPGFYVLPLDEAALAAWAELMVTGRLPRFTLSRAQRYPARLRALESEHRIDDLLDPAQPIEHLPELLDQLRRYLGENGYYWLCACAVSPIVRWELTLLLGEQYYLNAGVAPGALPEFIAHDYPRLAMLPWLRRQQMPDWLRLALLDSLSPRVQAEVRAVVRARLGQIRLDDDGDDALSLEAPPGPLGREPHPREDHGADTLYLGYLAGHSPRELMLRAPPEWSGWLAQLPRRQRAGLMRAWLAAWRDRLLWRKGLSLYGGARRLQWLAGGCVAVGVALVLAGLWVAPARLPEAWQAVLYHEQGRWIGGVHDAAIRQVAYRDGGASVVAEDWDGGVHQWDTRTGAPIGALAEGGDAALWRGSFSVWAFDAEGSRLATGSVDGRVRLWNAGANAPLGPAVAAHAGAVTSLAFNASESVLASGGADGVVRLWKAGTLEAINRPLQVGTRPVTALAFSPDGARLIAGDRQGVVQQWDLNTGRPIGPVLAGHVGQINAVAYSPDAAHIASASTDGTLRLWDAATGETVGAPMLGHQGAVNSLAFRADGQQLASGGSDGTVRFWSAAQTAVMRTDVSVAPAVRQSVFSPDGRLFATAGGDGVRLWDAMTGEAIGATLPGMSVAAGAVAFSPDGARVAAGSTDGQVYQWEVAGRALLGSSAAAYGRAIDALAYIPDGGQLLVATVDGQALRLDTQGGGLSGGATLDPANARAVAGGLTHEAFSRDGQRIVSASADGMLQLWDAGNSGAVQALSERGGPGYASVALSANGLQLVAGGMDGSLTLWDLLTQQRIKRPFGQHAGAVVSVAFSPDGRRILSAGEDGVVNLWEVETGARVVAPIQHPGPLSSAAFSPDGLSIVASWSAVPAAAIKAPPVDTPANAPALPVEQAPPAPAPTPRVTTPIQKQAPVQKSIPVPPQKTVPLKKSSAVSPASGFGALLEGLVSPLVAVARAADAPASAGRDGSVPAEGAPSSAPAPASPVFRGSSSSALGDAGSGSSSSSLDNRGSVAEGRVRIWQIPPDPLPVRPPATEALIWSQLLFATLGIWPWLVLWRWRLRRRQLGRWIEAAAS